MAYRAPFGRDPLSGGVLGTFPQTVQQSNIGILGAMQPAQAPPLPTLPASSFPSFLTSDPDPSLVTGGAAAMADRNGGFGPMDGSQKWKMLLSGISDAANTLGGRQTDNYAQAKSAYLQQQQHAARTQALSDYQNAKTPADKQSAMMRLWASGADTAGLGTALKTTLPELRDIPANGSLAVIDPSTGLPSSVLHGTPLPQKPIVSNGMQTLDNGKTWAPIPGYAGQQSSIATARRAPAKAKAPGAIIGNPASLFGAH